MARDTVSGDLSQVKLNNTIYGLRSRYDCEVVVDTRNSASSQYTATISADSLYNGLTIAIYTKYDGSSDAATLQVTFKDGTTSSAVPIYLKDSTRLTNQIKSGQIFRLTYLENAMTDVTASWHCDCSNSSSGSDISTFKIHRTKYNYNAAVTTIATKNIDAADTVANGHYILCPNGALFQYTTVPNVQFCGYWSTAALETIAVGDSGGGTLSPFGMPLMGGTTEGIVGYNNTTNAWTSGNQQWDINCHLELAYNGWHYTELAYFPVPTTNTSILPSTYVANDKLYLKGKINEHQFTYDSLVATSNLTNISSGDLETDEWVYWEYGKIISIGTNTVIIQFYTGQLWEVVNWTDDNYAETKVIPYNGLKHQLYKLDQMNGVTAAEKSIWNSKYEKPSGGIPSTDLAKDYQLIYSTTIADNGVRNLTVYDDASKPIKAFVIYASFVAATGDGTFEVKIDTASVTNTTIYKRTKALSTTGTALRCELDVKGYWAGGCVVGDTMNVNASNLMYHTIAKNKVSDNATKIVLVTNINMPIDSTIEVFGVYA